MLIKDLFSSGQYDIIIRNLNGRERLKKDEFNYLVQAYIQKGNVNAATNILRRYIKVHSNIAIDILKNHLDLIRAGHPLLGLAYNALGKWNQAELHWKLALSKRNDKHWRIEYFKSLLYQNKTELYSYSAAQSLKDDDYNDNQLLWIFTRLITVDTKLASSLILSKKYDGSPIQKLITAKIYVNNNRYKDAIIICENILKNGKTNNQDLLKTTYNIIIQGYTELQKYQKVIKVALQMKRDFPKIPQPYLTLLYNAHRNNDIKLYDDIIQEAFSVFKYTDISIVLRYSHWLERKGKIQKSKEVIAEAFHSSDDSDERLFLPYARHLLLDGKDNVFIDLVKYSKSSGYIKLNLLKSLISTQTSKSQYSKLPSIADLLEDTKFTSLKELEAYFDALNSMRQSYFSLSDHNMNFDRIFNDSEQSNLLKSLRQKNLDYTTSNIITRLFRSEHYPSNKLSKLFKKYAYIYISGQANVMLESYERPSQAQAVANEVKKRITNKTPTSLIRLGDGEGNFLTYHDDLFQYQKNDQERIQYIWWKQNKLDAGIEAKETIARFKLAIQNSDILGIPPLRIFFQAHNSIGNKNINDHSIRGNLAILKMVNEQEMASKFIISSKIHIDLNTWSLYESIFEHVNKISIISCHENISNYVEKVYGIEDVELITIPSEKRFQHIFGYEKELNNHYPQRYNEILEKIKGTEKGRVYIVAAGFLGKIYCDAIKRAGGIGLDLGSIPDLWLNYNTRQLFDLHLIKHGVHYNNLGIAKGVPNQIINTNFYRNKLLTPKPIQVKQIKILITGHPRTGTKFCSQLFAKYDIHLGHEKLESDGMVSWLHAVCDQNTPYFVSKRKAEHRISRYDIKPEHFLLIVRDPKDAIPSIILENMNNISYQFRRFHIYNQSGIDLESYSNKIEKAIVSYVQWIEIIEQQSPHYIIKLENLETDIESFLHTISSSVHKKAAFDIDKNISQSKYDIQKPVLSNESLHEVSKSVKTMLDRFCIRHNYQSLF